MDLLDGRCVFRIRPRRIRRRSDDRRLRSIKTRENQAGDQADDE
ncbi:hypothetical protein [Lysobacter antibioticus]|nr:hypothetical protein [Lysobacter antibioticus]